MLSPKQYEELYLLEKEISNYLMKPFTKKELFKAIKESLNQ